MSPERLEQAETQQPARSEGPQEGPAADDEGQEAGADVVAALGQHQEAADGADARQEAVSSFGDGDLDHARCLSPPIPQGQPTSPARYTALPLRTTLRGCHGVRCA